MSGWTREGRSNPKKVGHGGGGMNMAKSKLLKINPRDLNNYPETEPLKFNLVIKINTVD